MPSKVSFDLIAALATGVVLAACTGGGGASDEPAGAGGSGGGASAGSSNGGGGPSPVCQAGGVVPSFHRLNRIEYQNSVNFALGTDLPLASDLPVDSLVYGFDNNADVSMSATLMQKYLNVAESAVAAALASPATRAALVPCSLTEASCARSVLERFIAKAYRRPASAAEVDEALGYLQVCSSSAEAGIGCALQATLLSSKFLFRMEFLATEQAKACTEVTPLTASADGKLAPLALASRLSYWLTTSPPDAELVATAESGMLGQPAVMAAQVERLLAAPAGATRRSPFLENFPSQWLQLNAAAAAMPSPKVFPAFDEALRSALGAESRQYFAAVLTGGRSALDLVRSDFSFLNARLAQHYGIAGVSGDEMRLVTTTGSLRGGILTQGSFLTATSSSENTSIVQRAKWVLTNLLCSPLPAPPDGAADAVPAPDPGLGLTNRESLTRRTANPPCAGCHVVMNPIGFGLEVFDAVGAFRTQDRGKPIDSSGQLPTGETFADTEGLLTLLKHDARFPACLTKKMLTYALGRGIEASCDADALKKLGDEFAADGYDLKKHIVRLAQSPMFQTARAFVDPTLSAPESMEAMP